MLTMPSTTKLPHSVDHGFWNHMSGLHVICRRLGCESVSCAYCRDAEGPSLCVHRHMLRSYGKPEDALQGFFFPTWKEPPSPFANKFRKIQLLSCWRHQGALVTPLGSHLQRKGPRYYFAFSAQKSRIEIERKGSLALASTVRWWINLVRSMHFCCYFLLTLLLLQYFEDALGGKAPTWPLLRFRVSGESVWNGDYEAASRAQVVTHKKYIRASTPADCARRLIAVRDEYLRNSAGVKPIYSGELCMDTEWSHHQPLEEIFQKYYNVYTLASSLI